MIIIRQAEQDKKWYFLHTIGNDLSLIPTALFSEGTDHKKAQAILLELHSRGLCGNVTLEQVKEKMELVKTANLAVIHKVKTSRVNEFFESRKNNVHFYF